MTYQELNKAKLGSKVKYGPYNGVILKSFDEKYVTLVDTKGAIKNVYTALFLKWGVIHA